VFAYRCVLYRLYNGQGQLLYIGISGDVHKRLSAHARTQPWWPEVESCQVEFFPTRDVLADAERLAIREEHPRHNIVGRANEENTMEAMPLADTEASIVEVHPDGLVIDGQKVTCLSVVESQTTTGLNPAQVIVNLRIAIRASMVTVRAERMVHLPAPCDF
jgi:hypothetical protein